MNKEGERSRQHRRALEIIASNPQDFIDGLDHPVESALEIILPENGEAVTETDVRLVMANGDLHLIEFKLNSDGKYRRRAKQQLEKAKAWYRRNMGFSSEKIYTHTIFGDNPETLISLKKYGYL
jgi:hypothetical protein